MTGTSEISRGSTTSQLANSLGVSLWSPERVEVDLVAVARMAKNISAESGTVHQPAAWDDDTFWNVGEDAFRRSQYFAIGNSINFRFWSLDGATTERASGLVGGQAFSGAMYMWRCLRRVLAAGQVPILDARFLAELSSEDFANIFVDDDGNHPLEVGSDERIANLRDLGAVLLARWEGEFLNVARASGGSVQRFVELSSEFRAFDDPIFKLTMVNAILHSGSGVFVFSDELLPGIDYHLLLHALRQGMIVPDRELGQALARGELLTAHEALNLRRAALQAFVALSADSGIDGERLDNKFWLNRVNCTEQPICTTEHAARCPFISGCARHVAFKLPLELTRYY